MLVGVMSESKLVSVECVNGSIKCQGGRDRGRERERDREREREKQREREREKQRKKLPFQRNEAMQP